MSYKIIFPILFLMSFSIVGKSKKNESIQKLEEQIAQKKLEVFSLGSMIAQKHEQHSKNKSDFKYLMTLIINKRIERLEKQNGGILSQEDKDKVNFEVRKKAEEFLYKFLDDLKNHQVAEGTLVEDLFEHDKSDVDLFKFYYLRLVIDQESIWSFVKKYEDSIKELNSLMNELIDLKKTI